MLSLTYSRISFLSYDSLGPESITMVVLAVHTTNSWRCCSIFSYGTLFFFFFLLINITIVVVFSSSFCFGSSTLVRDFFFRFFCFVHSSAGWLSGTASLVAQCIQHKTHSIAVVGYIALAVRFFFLQTSMLFAAVCCCLVFVDRIHTVSSRPFVSQFIFAGRYNTMLLNAMAAIERYTTMNKNNNNTSSNVQRNEPMAE